MVMEELMQDFLKKNSGIKSVHVETIPPGQILKGQILKQGQTDGKDTAMNPDIYASVNLGHPKTLKGKVKMDSFMAYIHNQLDLMVAAGNPKGIKGPRIQGVTI